MPYERAGRRCRRINPDRRTQTCRLTPGHTGLHRWWSHSGAERGEWGDEELCSQCHRWPRMMLLDSDRCAICAGLTPLRAGLDEATRRLLGQ